MRNQDKIGVQGIKRSRKRGVNEVATGMWAGPLEEVSLINMLLFQYNIIIIVLN